MSVTKPKGGGGCKRRRVLIVDDHPMMREGLRSAIDRTPDLVVCGEAENALQAMNAVQKLGPDLALVDITLPGKSGLELVKDLKRAHPQLAVLAISMHDESLYAERVLRAGAGGYISKQQAPDELLRAIRQVLDKQVYVSKKVSENLLRRFSRQPPGDVSAMSLLTDREFEVLQLLAEGESQKDIARRLHLSAKTIAVHSANIRQKLNLQTTAQLIRYAIQSDTVRSAQRG
jgi:DNA-binding NarL/FixJ family response regulator